MGSSTTANGSLTAEEAVALAEAEAVLDRDRTGYIEKGRALSAIRHKKLYRASHPSFETYVVERWGMHRAYAIRLADAYDLVEELSPNGDIASSPIGDVPTGEYQARALLAIKDDNTRANIIERIRGNGGFENITAEQITRMAEMAEDVAGDADPAFVPTFTVLNQRKRYWTRRRALWRRFPIRPALPPIRKTYGSFDQAYLDPDTIERYGEETYSDFDPVIAELAVEWWCPRSGWVLDPFAGGSARGIVASHLGHPYTGVELRGDQVEANREDADASPDLSPPPTWIHGDADVLLDTPNLGAFDLVLTSPPFADLEVYSDHPADLSNMPRGEFEQAYRRILSKSVGLLREDRFAAIVIGNVRDNRGHLRNLHGLTVEAMTGAGAHLHDEVILVGPVGTGAIRAPGQFRASRTLVRTHSFVLVFVRGDPKRAAAACA